jgi:acetyltransferase-like isoleucine patch superfamily enzyme
MLYNFIKIIIKRFRMFFISYKRNVRFSRGCKISWKSKFEGSNVLNENVFFDGYLGYASFIGSNSYFVKSNIGRFCSIASEVKVIIGNHPSKVFVSTHPAFFSTRKQAGFSYTKEQLFDEIKFANEDHELIVNIGNDVWIGYGVKILNGVNIGDGAIVGADSLVLNDVEPYGIYAGIPAKKIGTRFSPEDIKFLLEFKWWENDSNWLRSNAIVFKDIKSFREKFNSYNN